MQESSLICWSDSIKIFIKSRIVENKRVFCKVYKYNSIWSVNIVKLKFSTKSFFLSWLFCTNSIISYIKFSLAFHLQILESSLLIIDRKYSKSLLFLFGCIFNYSFANLSILSLILLSFSIGCKQPIAISYSL